MTEPNHQTAMTVEQAQPIEHNPAVIDAPTVVFADGRYATFTRVTILDSGVLVAELTRTIEDETHPEVGASVVTDIVHYGPSAWRQVYTRPRGLLTAWTWRRDDDGNIAEHRQLVASDITTTQTREHAAAWLRRYAIDESQLTALADLAFTQRITVSDPDTIALKFYFQLP